MKHRGGYGRVACWSLCIMAWLSAGAWAADLTIGPQGDTAAIVVADGEWMAPEAWVALDPRQKRISTWFELERMHLPYQAALLLQEVLEQVTGHKLALLSETQWEQQQRPAAIHVGRTRETVRNLGGRLEPPQLEHNGFVLQSRPGLLMLCGLNSYATYNAAGWLLERQAGVDWFWPGEIGVELPDRGPLVIDRLDTTFIPAVVFNSGTFGAWGARIGESKPELRGGSHEMAPTYFHPGRETRPEWFSVIDGERLIPTASQKYFTWQPCMAGPSPLQRLVTLTRHNLRDEANPRSIAIGYNDGIWQPCQCRFCLAADSGYHRDWDTMPFLSNGGRASSRYFRLISHLANELQADYPGFMVGGWSYAGTDVPPAGVAKNPHLAINVIGTKLSWLNPELREWEERRIEAWGRLAGTLMTYDYFYQTGPIPVHVPHHYADVVRTFQRLGIRYEYAETYQQMAFAGPKYWLHMKLCQNPSQDVDYLLERWLNGMFHEAAEPMSRFYATIEDAWETYPYHGRHARGWSSYVFAVGLHLPVMSPAHVEQMASALSEAEAVAKLPRVKERLAAVRAGFTLTDERAKYLWKRRPLYDPVPYDLESLQEDWQQHLAAAPFFNPQAHFEAVCAPFVEQELFTNRLRGQLPEAYDDPANRLSRVAVGLASLALDADRPETDEALRQRLAEQLSTFAGTAPPAARGTLEWLVSRSLVVPLVADAAELANQPVYGDFRQAAEVVAPPVVFVPAPLQTQFQIAHDGHALLIRAVLEGPVGEQDELRVFVAPGNQASHGYTLIISDLTAEQPTVKDTGEGYGDAYWEAGSEVQISRDGQAVVLELAIPFGAFLYSPQATDRLIFNMQRTSGETASLWYPLPGGTARGMGGIPVAIEFSEPQRFAAAFEGQTMPALNGVPTTCEVTDEVFTRYLLAEGRDLLLGRELIDIYPGIEHEVRVIFSGEGHAHGGLRFYHYSEDGPIDVLTVPELSTETSQLAAGRRLSVSRVRLPVEKGQLLADSARLWLETEGEVQIHHLELVPKSDLLIELQVDSTSESLATGQICSFLATITNQGDQPVTGLQVDISSVDGLDRRAPGLLAAETLAPGDTTYALWYYVPTYGIGQARVNVVVEADNRPRVIHRTYGP